MLGGHVIFCDDIRQEVGGKATYVGRYQGSIIVDGALPVLLSKLGVVVVWNQTLDEELLPVDWALLVPGSDEPRATGSFDVPSIIVTDSQLPKEERTLTMETSMLLVPFELLQEGDIRVVATRGGKAIHLRRLEVQIRKSAVAERGGT